MEYLNQTKSRTGQIDRKIIQSMNVGGKTDQDFPCFIFVISKFEFDKFNDDYEVGMRLRSAIRYNKLTRLINWYQKKMI